MAATAWTDELLDELREVGDPPADAVVARDLRRRPGRVRQPPDEDARAQRRGALQAAAGGRAPLPGRTDDLPDWADPERIAVGERFFGQHGPGCVMALACASLPACYAARKGVQVLHLTARLQTDPVRRIGETAQLTLDAMAPGGLAPGGAGVRDAQKVRLMHAAVRHLVGTSGAWDPDWGVPVNQEDLGGTLMTFSIVVVDSLRRLGVSVSDEEADAYLHAWNCVGHIMGVDARLLADTEDEGRALSQRIIERQWAPCPEGQAMTKALIDTMETRRRARSSTASRATSCATSAGTNSATSSASSARTGRGCSAGRCACSRATAMPPSTTIRWSPPSRSASAGSCWRASAGSPAAASGHHSTSRMELADRWGVRTAARHQRTRNVTARLREPR